MDVAENLGIFLARSVEARGRNDYELTPTVKMETRHLAGKYVVTNFRRYVIIAELRRPEVA